MRQAPTVTETAYFLRRWGVVKRGMLRGDITVKEYMHVAYLYGVLYGEARRAV